MKQRTKAKPLYLAVVLMWLLNLGSFFTTTPALAEDSQYFPETGKTVSGKFLQYWRTNGGLTTYGYPITDAQPEIDPETNQTFLTQWFERNRFELHPENAGTKYEVLLGLLGKDLRREALEVDPDFLPAKPLGGANQPNSQQIYFNETHHNLSYGFLAYWQANGGLERFGYPLSDERSEVDPETGRVFTTQWFERARFEYHPENQPPYQILLGLLGNQLKAPKSKIEFSWQIKPATNTKFSMAAGPQSLYLLAVDYDVESNKRNPTIYRYDTKGHFLTQWTLSDKLAVKTISAGPLAVDSQEQLYVVDNLNSRILKFDANGNNPTTLITWKQPELPPGYTGFIYVNDLAIDNAGNVYVLSISRIGTSAVPIYGIRLTKYDRTGKLLLNFPLPEGGDDSLAYFEPASAIAADGQGNVYLTDTGRHRIMKYDPNGKLLTKWGSQGEGNGQFTEPTNVRVDAAGTVYVSDAQGSRLQKFDSNGAHLLTWYWSLGAAAGEINGNVHLTVDPQGNIFTTGANDQRLGKFRSR